MLHGKFLQIKLVQCCISKTRRGRYSQNTKAAQPFKMTKTHMCDNVLLQVVDVNGGLAAGRPSLEPRGFALW